MGILNLQMDFVGQVGVSPRRGKMVTTDALATVTAAGYLNNQTLQGNTIYPTDLIDVCYSFVQSSNSGTDVTLTVAISNGVITLSEQIDAGNVILPVVSGDFAVFSGTAGQIADNGYLPSNPALTKVVMANGATVANALAVFSDTAGTLKAQSTASTLAFGLTLATGALSVPNLLYGATPVAQVDPGSCTITAAAGAANHCTITIQLKDGSGTNMTRVTPFKVYLATTNSGLILQSAASTGYSVTSGGVVDPTGSTTITQGLAAFSSASGGCVVDLLDTAKGTGNLILMLPNGFKASAAITSGSYG